MKTGNAGEFARNTFTEHISSFFSLSRQISSGRISVEKLAVLEEKNKIFPGIDYRVFAVRQRSLNIHPCPETRALSGEKL
jgi:predicted glycosyl hydrolase (DUF1957 family)